MFIRRTIRTIELAIVSALILLPLSAQERQLLHIVSTKLQPGALAEYREMQTPVNQALKKDGIPWRQVWSTAVFGDPMFVSAVPVEKMDRYETPNPVRKMMNDADYELYVKKMSRLVAESKSKLVVTRPDLGLSSGRSIPKHAVITTVVVAPGRHAEFESYVKSEVIPAWKKAGIKDVWANAAVFGTYSTEYNFVALFDDWSEMNGGGPIVRVLGQEAWDNVRSKIAGLATSVQNGIASYHPALSYMPEQ